VALRTKIGLQGSTTNKIGLNGFSVAPTFAADPFMVNNSNVQTVTFGLD
jgi:hypothetical protein